MAGIPVRWKLVEVPMIEELAKSLARDRLIELELADRRLPLFIVKIEVGYHEDFPNSRTFCFTGERAGALDEKYLGLINYNAGVAYLERISGS